MVSLIPPAHPPKKKVLLNVELISYKLINIRVVFTEDSKVIPTIWLMNVKSGPRQYYK